MSAPRSPDEMSGVIIADRYRLESLLGSGGSGAVYVGTDLQLGRRVAVKLIAPHRVVGGSKAFEVEAMAASRLNHPNAVAIYDLGTWQELPYLIMEEAPGASLATLLEGGPLSSERAIGIAVQLLDALAEAHRCGVIHCDLSSDNIIVDERDGRDSIKVIDFGLARLSDSAVTDRVVGTVEYLAPEQILRQTITPAVDLYAAGILLYEMLVGRTPFAGATEAAIIQGHLTAEPEAPSAVVAGCPVELGEVVRRALSKDPLDRAPSAKAMQLDLLEIRGEEPFAGFLRAPESLPRPRELIGRAAEKERLREFLCDRAGALVLSGGEGLGKKRLVYEVARSTGPGSHVLIAEASPLDGPWGPILRLLGSILGIDRPTVSAISRGVAKLGLPDRDVPGLCDLFGIGEPRDMDRETLRTEALASALRVMRTAARRLPRISIAFTDIERYDRPSRDLALELARTCAESGLAIVITSRVPIAVPGALHLELTPLSSDHTRALLGVILPEKARPAALGLGSLSPARAEQLAGWAWDGHPLAHAPSTQVDLVSQRILHLPAPSRLLIQTVAAFGGEVSLPTLAELVDRSSIVPIPALIAITANQVKLHSSEVIDIASACTPADVRRRLHRQILAALGDEAPPLTRARHAELADEHELAYSMYSKAGFEAFSRFDSFGAATYYRAAADRARVLFRRGLPNAERQFVAAAIFAAEALLDDGEFERAADLLEEVELFAPTGAPRAAYLRANALVALGKGESERGRGQLEAAIGEALAAGDLELLCDAYLELADSLSTDGQGERARGELEQAIAVATGGIGWTNARAPKRLWRIGHRLAELHLGSGEIEAAREVAADALALARRRDSTNGQARLSALMATLCERAGDFGSALRYRANAIKGLRSLGDRRSTAEVLLASAATTDRETIDLARTLASEIGWNTYATGSEDDKA